ncbi:ARM repeat superfamily protein [Striga asiatica]|uniref:ARM repeat superfamily protein n=1 Tax=Striga asiatica TaxID=4170 RepID=A0A5A7PB92_STRAF|nr:ARM repeat superfamily protein [Striga asiatica]
MPGEASNSETESTIRLQISDLKTKLDGTRSINSSPTIFEPQTSAIDAKPSSTLDETPVLRPPIKAPEKKLTLFALRLAILEKSASGIGTLGFIWATVVLLGGFAITLSKTDFWFITVILLIEGTRIFSRSHELEWQHQATWSITDVGINSFRALKTSSNFIVTKVKSVFKTKNGSRKISRAGNFSSRKKWDERRTPTRIWTSSEVPLLPYAKWVFISKNVSKLLYWLQLASATACVVLSLIKLVRRDFGEVEKGDTDKRNRKSALFIFYSLALAEALLFLLEKAYWEWKVSSEKLLESVSRDCELGESGLISIRRFFYDAYSKCVNGSIFDGLKMDMVQFGMELLGSGSPDEQLIGARILRQFSGSPRFSDDTLQKIGISLPVMERLVEMLNWNDPQEKEIRYSAAEILSRLAGKTQNSSRIAGIPGALESISSLLHDGRAHSGACDHISDKKTIVDNENYGSWAFNHIGLQILKKLARDHDICGKIGNTKGLLPKIVDFTHADERLLTHPTAAPSQVATVKRSLQVLRMLAGTAGHAGKQLRKEISEIVFTVGNIRDILKYGGKQPELQMLGIEILTSLAIEEEATERIGGTGGVIKVLFGIFFDDGIPEDWGRVRAGAGEALAMLALESRSTCARMLRMGFSERLIRALKVPLLRINGARVLRNLCAYGGDDCYQELKGLTAAAPVILEVIMKEEHKLQEVMIGAGAGIFRFMSPHNSKNMFREAGLSEFDLAHRLFMILKKYRHPSTKVPSIRRYTIELAIWMMKNDETNVRVFRSLGMKEELECVVETTTELESFNIFSGTVGLYRHKMPMHSLVGIAMGLLEHERS